MLPSHIMLENILDSFDHLVDARLHQYSKVLKNHGQSLSSSGAQIVEYKLRTLLEIGTNISFGSISTKFVPTEEKATTTVTDSTCSLPVLLTVEIDSLQFHHRTYQSHPHHQRLTFQAPGTLQGKQKHSVSTTCSCSAIDQWFAKSVLFSDGYYVVMPKQRGSYSPCCFKSPFLQKKIPF